MAIRDEVFVGLRKESCPSDDQEAAERVSDAINMPAEKAAILAAVEGVPTDEGAVARIGATSSISFEGLIGCLFKDFGQFRRAMKEYGWNLELPKFLCKNAIRKTYKVTAVGPHSSAYLFILEDTSNKAGDEFTSVRNCQITAVGDAANEEDLAAYREVAEAK